MTSAATRSDAASHLISVSKDGVSVLSPRITVKIKEKKLSASLVKDILDGCPARWAAGSVALRGVLPSGIEARRGSFFHRVMECFFALTPDERTYDALMETVRAVLTEPDFAEFAEDIETKRWLKKAIDNYYRMGAQPQRVHVAPFLNEEGEEEVGLEINVSGKVGNAKRPMIGVIDRVMLDPASTDDNPILIVEDWKTSEKAKRGAKAASEIRQQLIYHHLLTQQGYTVSGARLLYPVAGEVVRVDTESQAARDRMIAEVEQAERDFDAYIEDNLFPTRPSVLCAWCPLAKVCPTATIIRNDKVEASYATQPEPEELAPYVRM